MNSGSLIFLYDDNGDVSKAVLEQEIQSKDVYKILLDLGTDKQLDSFILLYNLFKDEINIHQHGEMLFRSVCSNEQENTAAWMLENLPDLNIHAMREGAFANICYKGNKRMAEWLWSASEKSIKLEIADGLIYDNAVRSGSIQLVRWLFSLDYRMDADEIGYRCILTAAGLGFKEIAEEVYRVCSDTKLGRNSDDIFVTAATNGHTDFAAWIYGIRGSGINLHFDNEYVFRHACLSGYLETAAWLWEISKQTINPRIMNDYIFEEACINNNIELLSFLDGIVFDYLYEVKDNRVISHRVIDLLRMIEKGFDNGSMEGIPHTEITGSDTGLECLICLSNSLDRDMMKVCFNDHHYCIECYLDNHKKTGYDRCLLCKKRDKIIKLINV